MGKTCEMVVEYYFQPKLSPRAPVSELSEQFAEALSGELKRYAEHLDMTTWARVGSLLRRLYAGTSPTVLRFKRGKVEELNNIVQKDAWFSGE